MQYIPQIAFILVTIAAIYLFFRKAKDIRRNILLGRDEEFSNSPAERSKNVLLIALGQKKMFKRPVPALLHLFIYVGFIVINLEVLEFVIDGLAGTHRICSMSKASSGLPSRTNGVTRKRPLTPRRCHLLKMEVR